MPKLSRAQAGRKGGLTTKSRHGSGFYSSIGRKGARKGGKRTLERHGVDHFRQIGKKGGNAKAARK